MTAKGAKRRWYLATCQSGCVGREIPFGAMESRNDWARIHAGVTGHTVSLTYNYGVDTEQVREGEYASGTAVATAAVRMYTAQCITCPEANFKSTNELIRDQWSRHHITATGHVVSLGRER
jgi:hypothetical protein